MQLCGMVEVWYLQFRLGWSANMFKSMIFEPFSNNFQLSAIKVRRCFGADSIHLLQGRRCMMFCVFEPEAGRMLRPWHIVRIGPKWPLQPALNWLRGRKITTPDSSERTWGRGWMTKASGVGERRREEVSCGGTVIIVSRHCSSQRGCNNDIWHMIYNNDIYIWGKGQGGALSREKSRNVLGEPRNTC